MLAAPDSEAAPARVRVGVDLPRSTSMNLMTFHLDGTAVRSLRHQNSEPWFVAADVCGVLGLGNPRMTLTRLDDEERVSVQLTPLAALSKWGLSTSLASTA